MSSQGISSSSLEQSSSSSITDDLIKECEEQLAQAVATQQKINPVAKAKPQIVQQNLSGVKRPREEEYQLSVEQTQFRDRINVMRTKVKTNIAELLEYMEVEIINTCVEYYQNVDARNKVLEAENARLKAKLDCITKAMQQ